MTVSFHVNLERVSDMLALDRRAKPGASDTSARDAGKCIDNYHPGLSIIHDIQVLQSA